MNNNKNAFTLVEIMISVLIFSLVITSGFYAYSSILIGKSRLIAKTDIQKDSFYFTEKLFETIKKGGTLDYEEYFNRKVIGTTTGSGHYDKPTGFGNFGDTGSVGSTTYGNNFYQCRSGNGSVNKLGNTGCFNNNLNSIGSNLLGNPQRYGQYSFQFIDYNSNYDSDLGDEDGNGNIIGDDDDEYIGDGPVAFTGGTNVRELYLISGDKKSRTLFRWNIEQDKNAPSGYTCTNGTGSGCIGTIEVLKLDGIDSGLNHDNTGIAYGDGVIDTWLINNEFSGDTTSTVIAGSNNTNYWVKLFPDSINVTDFRVYTYPNIDIDNAWKSNNEEKKISPYVTLHISFKPSWLTRKKLKQDSESIEINTTINLSDIYSQ